MITKKEPLKLVSSKKMTMYKSDMYMKIEDRYKLSESLIIGEELKYLIISGQEAASLYNRYMTVFLNYRKFFLASHKFGFAKLANIRVSDTFFRQDFTYNNIIYKRSVKNIESSLSMNIKAKDAVYVNTVKLQEKKIKNSKKLYILKNIDSYSVGKISCIKSIISDLKINNMLHYTFASGKINTIYEPFKYINQPQKMSFVKEIFLQKNPLYSVQKPVNGEVEKAKVYGHNINSNVILNKGGMYGYKILSALYSMSGKKIENKSAEKNVSVTDRLMLYSVINNIYEKEAVYNNVNSNFMSDVRENNLLYMKNRQDFNKLTEYSAENIHKGKVLVSSRENTVMQEAIFNGNIYNVKNHELFSFYRRSVTDKSDIPMNINIYNYIAENISGHWESMHKYPSVNINILRHSEGIREYEYPSVNILRYTESIRKYSPVNMLRYTESISKYPSFNILSHTESISKYLPSNILSHTESISKYSPFNILKHTEHSEGISEYLPFNILSHTKSMSEYLPFNILSHTESMSEYSSFNILKSGQSISEYPSINISKGGESIRKYLSVNISKGGESISEYPSVNILKGGDNTSEYPSVNISKYGENIWEYSADNKLMHVKGMHKYSTENMLWYEKNMQKYLIEKILRYEEKKQKHMTGRMLKYIENVQGYSSGNISGYVQALPVFYSWSGEKNILNNSQKNVSSESTLKETALNKERERFVYTEQTGYWKINKVQNVWNMEEAHSINRVQDIKDIHTLINAKNIGNVKDIENVQHFEDIQNKNIVQGAVETHELRYLHSQNSAESIKKTIQSIVERGQAVKTIQATEGTQATDGIQTKNIAQTIESMQTTDVIYAQDSIRSIQGNVINRRENLEDILREQEKIKEINKMIDARLQSQVKNISKQVYESIEQKLRGEKRRRGF